MDEERGKRVVNLVEESRDEGRERYGGLTKSPQIANGPAPPRA